MNERRKRGIVVQHASEVRISAIPAPALGALEADGAEEAVIAAVGRWFSPTGEGM